jgi:hypothetical protein
MVWPVVRFVIVTVFAAAVFGVVVMFMLPGIAHARGVAGLSIGIAVWLAAAGFAYLDHRLRRPRK